MFAIIQTGGKQYLVKEGQVLKIEKIPGEKGAEAIFDKVLMVASEDGGEVKIGQPYLEGVQVRGEILEQGRGKKVLVIKFKPKVRYRRKRGHRQYFTKVKIAQI